MIRVFLASSMGTVVFFLAILSIMLIYSLMLSDVDEKTYQYGMLRALGFKNKNLMALISMQSFSFSVPGLLGGLLVAYFLNLIVRYMIFIYAENTTNYDLSQGSIILGVMLGIFLPIISNIILIQRALSKNLRVSLDLYHRSVNELTVSIKRLEEMGLSVN
jgi:ABC-type antimicrobial peptide transport system permease subunit